MTNPSSSFAAAAQAAAQNNTPAPNSGATTQDRLIEPAEQDAGRLESRLFGGDRMPSILTKKHDVGDSVTGTIKDLPFEKQSRTFVEGGVGKLKYWPATSGKPVKHSTDPTTGQPLKPVMDLVVPISTAYRMTAAELERANLEEQDDDGTRGWFISSGQAEKALKDALKRARVRAMADLVGMTITITRMTKVEMGENMAWTYKVELTK